ncbi:hypothetical protein BDZ91DRAFT_725964 [Kalaharituber pfeilii]|nr:hypothetical protein BDZ91DRAFT_725964 [Kalaharituber pfeilii]
MRIRVPFAISFLILCAFAAYLCFSNFHVPYLNDKFLHFITFFFLTVCFYWILETSRRRVVNLTFFVITLILGTSSEFVQSLVNPERLFDPYDILANILGSGLALLLMQWYHKRMLERRRNAKTRYHAVATEEGNADLELDLEVGPSDEQSELSSMATVRARREEEEGGDGDIGVGQSTK